MTQPSGTNDDLRFGIKIRTVQIHRSTQPHLFLLMSKEQAACCLHQQQVDLVHDLARPAAIVTCPPPGEGFGDMAAVRVAVGAAAASANSPDIWAPMKSESPAFCAPSLSCVASSSRSASESDEGRDCAWAISASPLAASPAFCTDQRSKLFSSSPASKFGPGEHLHARAFMVAKAGVSERSHSQQ